MHTFFIVWIFRSICMYTGVCVDSFGNVSVFKCKSRKCFLASLCQRYRIINYANNSSPPRHCQKLYIRTTPLNSYILNSHSVHIHSKFLHANTQIQFSSAFSIFINCRCLLSYRSTRCLLLATNSKCYRQSSPVTGDYRTRKTDRHGASARTTSIASNLRCLNVKCLHGITKIR